MPYSIDWYIEDEIIFANCWGKFTTEEFREVIVKTKEMVANSPRHLVHAITDVGDITEALPIVSAISVVKEIGAHPRSGWAITIREKSVIVKMSSAIGRSLLNVRARTFDTMEEAVTHLKNMDESLSWDKANSLILPKQ